MKSFNNYFYALFFFPLIILFSCEKGERKPYATSPDIYVPDTDFKVVGYKWWIFWCH
jgi:hypothetical protein